jgi:hypothetical protein
MIIFVVSVALLTLCNLATFLLSLPSNLMTEKRDARRESSATNKTILLTVGDSSVEQKKRTLRQGRRNENKITKPLKCKYKLTLESKNERGFL